MFISRLCLSQSSAIRAIADILAPSGPEGGLAKHKLLWSAFSDGADRTRDFLWREMGKGEFLTLSDREPEITEIFARDVREFKPVLNAGDRIRFQLRANATRTKMNPNFRQGDRKVKSGPRVDIVMDALKDIPLEQRAEKRLEIASREGKAWLTGQGEKNGFAVQEFVLDGYRTENIVYQKSGKQPHFGVLDMSGILEILDPQSFLAKVKNGFGREKSYGCGLMMIRRF